MLKAKWGRAPAVFLILFVSWSLWAQSPASRPNPKPGPVQFVDAAGRAVKLETRPRRIVAVGKGPHLILHLLYMFPEGPSRVAGMEKKGGPVSEFLELVDPSFKNRATLAGGPGPEAIAALQPDLVLIKGSAAERLSQALAEIGIPVAYLSLETPAEFFRDLANVGLILGNESRAAEIAAFYRSHIERITSALAGSPPGVRPRVLLLMATDRGGRYAVQVPAEGWMQTYQVRTAGGAPVWLEAVQKTSGWTIVNLEQIAAWDPDQAYVVIWHSLQPRTVVEAFKADQQWAALKCVRTGKLFAFPSDIFGWDSPDPRWILGLTWLAGKIHPGLFKNLNMAEEVREFYGTLYNLDRSFVDRVLLPKIELDVH